MGTPLGLVYTSYVKLFPCGDPSGKHTHTHTVAALQVLGSTPYFRCIQYGDDDQTINNSSHHINERYLLSSDSGETIHLYLELPTPGDETRGVIKHEVKPREKKKITNARTNGVSAYDTLYHTSHQHLSCRKKQGNPFRCAVERGGEGPVFSRGNESPPKKRKDELRSVKIQPEALYSSVRLSLEY